MVVSVVAVVVLIWAAGVGVLVVAAGVAVFAAASWKMVVMVVMVLVTAACYVFRLRGGKWRTPEALARVMAEQS